MATHRQPQKQDRGLNGCGITGCLLVLAYFGVVTYIQNIPVHEYNEKMKDVVNRDAYQDAEDYGLNHEGSKMWASLVGLMATDDVRAHADVVQGATELVYLVPHETLSSFARRHPEWVLPDTVASDEARIWLPPTQDELEQYAKALNENSDSRGSATTTGP